MKRLRRLLCWLRRRHSNPVIFATDTRLGRVTWLCRDCFVVWNEYETTGRVKA